MTDANPVSSLDQFPRIPAAGFITVAESHAELHTLPSTQDQPATGRGFCPLLVNYSVLDEQQLQSRLPFKIPSIKTSCNRSSLLVERREGIPKALWDSWWEGGVKGVYECLKKADQSTDLTNTTKTVIKASATITSVCLKLYEAPSNFLTYLFPHLELKAEDVNEEYSPIRRWKESWIRAISWHPTAPYLALALKDDSIRCCLIGKDVVPMLRCQEQRNISCVAWRGYITTELAVGCEDCIIIWQLRCSVMSVKAGKDKATVLKVPGHGPVNCVQYSSDGMCLLSSSAKDSSVYIWDAFTHEKTPLKRVGGGGVPISAWAPSGNKFLSASPGNTFWVWKLSQMWECKRWATPKTKIEAACWNSNGTILLFASAGLIYGIFYELTPVDRFVSQADSIVKPLFNIEECHVLDTDENLEYKVGGKVRQMEWDPSGNRVAVMFDDSEMIALFRVLPKSRTEILMPLGFIRGHPDESPYAITFQKDFKDGALLTIAWSTGRMQYFPMIFALPSSNRNMMHEEYFRTQNLVQGRPSLFAAAGFVSPRLSVSGAEAILSRQSVSNLINEREEPTSPSRLFSVAGR